MLPAASFTQAIKNAEHGSERERMGEYLPTGAYLADNSLCDAPGC